MFGRKKPVTGYSFVNEERSKLTPAKPVDSTPPGFISVKGANWKVLIPIAVLSVLGPAAGVIVGRKTPSDLEDRFSREAQANAEFREDMREQLRAIRETQMREGSAQANRMLSHELKVQGVEQKLSVIEQRVAGLEAHRK